MNEIKESAINEKATGFGEIFTADPAHNSETLYTAISFVDISYEAKGNESSDNDSEGKPENYKQKKR